MDVNARNTKPLLQWMDEGDPDLTPVVMGSMLSTAASYFGVPTRLDGESASFTEQQRSPVTTEMVLQCRAETGIQFHWSLGAATHLDALDFIDEIEIVVREEVNAQGEILKFTTMRTPMGEISEVFVTPPGKPAYWAEHLIKSDADLPALVYLIESAAKVTLENPGVAARLTEKFRSEAAKWPSDVPLYVIIGIPAFVLSSSLLMDPTTAFYIMTDHAGTLERLYEAYEQANGVWLGCAAEAGADIAHGAINGLELYSPDIYRKCFIPQARRLHELAHACGMRGWVHTCGHMDRLIKMGVYDEMDVDVLESLSSPPLGDIADLKAARMALGRRIVTRGAVNVDFFYNEDIGGLRRQVRHVLEATQGYRNMIGDTNDSFPPYPRENILALVDEVRKNGRMMIPGASYTEETGEIEKPLDSCFVGGYNTDKC